MSTGLLPTNNPIIQLLLDDEVDVKTLSSDALAKGVYLENPNKDRIYCSLSNPTSSLPEYEGSPKYVEKPNPRILRCSIGQKLPTSTQFQLVLNQSVYPGLRQPWTQQMNTPPEFRISEIIPASATELCVYSTTPLAGLYAPNAFTGVTIIPKVRIQEMSSYSRYSDSGEAICPPEKGLVSIIDLRML